MRLQIVISKKVAGDILQQVKCKSSEQRMSQGASATITIIYSHVEREITQNKRVKGKLNKIKK